jgi:hypothetical protein
MGKLYHLDLKTLIDTFEGQSGVLQRTIPKGVMNLKEPGVCSIHIAHGQIVQCMLMSKSGQLSDAHHLLPALYKLEKWDVTFTPVSRPSISPPQQNLAANPAPVREFSPSAPTASTDERLIPYQTIPLNQSHVARWSHQDRLLAQTILAHINGSNSIAEIRIRLSLPTNTFNKVLTQLYQLGIVRFRPQADA